MPPCVGQAVHEDKPAAAVTCQICFQERGQSGASVPDLRHEAGAGEVQAEGDGLNPARIARGKTRRGLDGIGNQLRRQQQSRLQEPVQLPLAERVAENAPSPGHR